MPIVTEKIYSISDVGDKTYAYGDIATFDGTSISDDSVLSVFLNGAELFLTTHYTVDDVADEVVLEASLDLTIGDSLIIRRTTDITAPFVDFINNSIIEASDLDLAVLQLLYAIQELTTDADNSLKYDVVNDCYDALNRRICNLGPATGSTDAVNLGQVQNLLAGVDTAEIDNLVRWSFVGDGSTTEFTLTSPPSGLMDASQVIVSVDGVVQLPTTNYTVTKSGTTVVTFTGEAPANTAIIQIITANGIVSVTFPDNSIAGTALEDDAVGVDKINVGLGVADRFLVFDINGDPTAQTIDHTLISDFDTGVRTNRLDQMTAPNNDIDMNTNQITGLVAGTLDTDAVNKGQMETYADAAAASAVATLSVSSFSDVSGSMSINTERSNSTDKAKYVVATIDGQSFDTTVSLKMAGESFVVLATVGDADTAQPISFWVPAGGGYKFSNVIPTICIEYIF